MLRPAQHQRNEQALRDARLDGGARPRPFGDQLLHFADPVIHRMQVVWIVHERVQQPGKREETADVIRFRALRTKAPVRALELRGCIVWRTGKARRGQPELQPGICTRNLNREGLDPAHQGLAASLRQQCLGLREQQRAQFAPIADLNQQCCGGVGLSLSGQQLGRTAASREQLFRTEHLARLAHQEFARQRMQLVQRCVLCRCRQQQIGVRLQALEQRRGIQVRAQALRQRRIDLRQHRDAQQHIACHRIELTEDHFAKIFEGQRRRRVQLTAVGQRALIAQQHRQRDRPALRTAVQFRQRRVVKLDTTQRDDAVLLDACELELIPADHTQLVVGAKTRQHGGRLDARHQDDVAARRNFTEPGLQDAEQAGRLRAILEIVEHQREGRVQPAEQLAEVAAGEHFQIGEEFRSQQRQRPTVRIALLHSLADEIKERGRIGIAPVDLVPDRVVWPVRQVIGHQRRLAGARRTGDPHHRARARFIQQAVQPLARQHVGRDRTCGLGVANGVPGDVHGDACAVRRLSREHRGQPVCQRRPVRDQQHRRGHDAEHRQHGPYYLAERAVEAVAGEEQVDADGRM